ncbi:COP9 signalosome complex subunit 3 [Leucoagaricus sp. SymC.cos]|nr:COP9 signalosome complex subunit 3 [Leucoagaricus sp. SymC.cos]
MDQLDLDTLIAQITSSTNPRQLNELLRNIQNDTREVILASTLSNGQDPLGMLDVRVDSLGVLFILYVILLICQFDVNQVRYAPERVIVVGKNLHRLALHYNNVSVLLTYICERRTEVADCGLLKQQLAAIIPLRALIQRYVPDPSYLTALHSQFLLLCVSNRRFTDALPILQHPITNIDTTDLTYVDNLIYHYTGGIALAALKQWSKAEEFFDICVTAPGIVPSAIQLEALKKMRLWKNSPGYAAFAAAYPNDVEALREIVKKERATFVAEKNLGLVNQAIERAPRWALKKLIGTYVTLNLTDIARQVKLDSEDQAREMLLNMIESNEISAQISSNGTVTFSDPPPTFTQSQVDALLRAVQNQSSLLNRLDMDLGKSREYLAKAVKLKDENWNAAEDVLYGAGPGGGGAVFVGSGGVGEGQQGVWVEEGMYTA